MIHQKAESTKKRIITFTQIIAKWVGTYNYSFSLKPLCTQGFYLFIDKKCGKVGIFINFVKFCAKNRLTVVRLCFIISISWYASQGFH